MRTHGTVSRCLSMLGRVAAPFSTLGLCLAAGILLARPATAATTLTVDLSTTIGPATHVASGSLYGVIEKVPADVDALIAPLHPKMFTNPAANIQQPIGDAIVVAGRVASTGAMVTIRLADWLKGFYTFTTMADWLDKIGQTVSRKKAAGLTNIYAYEIWNEPNGTYASSNPLSFNEFWRQTFVELRRLDPEVKITGPSLSYYNESFLKDFLSFCKTNSCLPDIVGWHELGGGNFTSTLQSYRALEKQLGIGPLPISINEYSGSAHIDVEGQPGASAPLIAKFERLGVDTACISFWDVPNPGHLGSLMASNTAANGGWWFYKWYGDMAGTMVSTTPPTPSSATALDGFANLDATAGTASVLFGGVNDGTIQIIVKGFKSAPFLASPVHAVVEHTPFVNRTTAVKATDTVSAADVSITNDQITVSVTNANATDGYRLKLGATGGGTGGPIGADAGVGARDGSLGGSGGAGGVPGTGGNTGGKTGTGGAGGTDVSADARDGAVVGGSGGSGGVASSGGASGPRGSGGVSAMGGISASSGGTSGGTGGSIAAGTGGAQSGVGGSARGGASGAVGSSRGGATGTVGQTTSAGCACQLGSSSARPGALGFSILLLMLAWGRGRRRRRGPAH